MTNKYRLREAYLQALFSKDLSSQNGALIVNAFGTYCVGCNNIPKGVVAADHRYQRPDKYDYTEHAERAAVYAAARNGTALGGGTMYCPWAACCDCARSIICSGIVKVVVHKERMDLTTGTWKASVDKALGMLAEADVFVEYESGSIEGAGMIRVDGKLWSPETLKFV